MHLSPCNRFFVAILTSLLALAAGLLTAQEKSADTRLLPAREHLQKGRYDEAIEAYAALAENKDLAESAAIGQSAALQALGRWKEATAMLEAAFVKNGKHPGLAARLAEILFRQGEYAQAEKLAAQALELDPQQPLAHRVQADVLAETGKIAEADQKYRWFVRYYNQAQPKDAETLLLVAEGATQYARWNSVSQVFSFVVNTLCVDALKADPQSWQANHISGSLLLEKYNRAQALPELKKALEINPRAADVLAALGEAAYQEHDMEEAGTFADQALAINAAHVGALHVKADLAISGGELGQAIEFIDRALAVNPHDQRTLARRGAVWLLQDGVPPDKELAAVVNGLADAKSVQVEQPSRFSKLLLEVAARNPHPGYFLNVAGSLVEGRRQYALAEKFYEAAMRVMPQLAEPKTSLGMLYMRVGKTAEAQKILDDAFKADPYHVRVSNMRKVLKLLEGYETITTDHFIIHVDSELDRVLGEYMAEYLEEVYAELVAQFKYEPPQRTHFEIYNNAKGLSAHQWFSARMIGLPWIQTIGASTGVIVALASPTAADEPFNWARVLKHEFVHVVTLQQTGFNIPHWFTEALAVTAEGYPRPAIWNQLLLQRVPKGELKTLYNLNDGFIRPESALDWQFAYCQSRLYAQYMVEKYGEASIPKLLDAYRRNLPTERAIPEACGVDLKTFEAGYVEFLNVLVKELRGGMEAEQEQSLADLEKAHLAEPENAALAGKYALGLLAARQPAEARKLALEALKQAPHDPSSALVLAQLALRAQDVESAVERLEAALNREQPHKLLLTLLAKLKLAEAKYAEAAELYELGRTHFPYDVDWMKGAAAAYLKTGEKEKLVPILEELSQADADDAAVRKKLAELALEDNQYERAAKYATLALHIDILDADLHRMLGTSLRELKQHKKSVREFEVALRLKPADNEIELGLARSLLADGRPDDAKTHIAEVLKRQPDLAEALELQKEISKP